MHLAPPLRQYIVEIVGATRAVPEVRLGASPRAVLHLARAAKAAAALDGRPFVVPDDVQRLAVPVLAHRLLLTVEAHAAHRSAEEIVGGAAEPDPGATGWLSGRRRRVGVARAVPATSLAPAAAVGSRGLTTRGRCLLAGGIAARVCALVLDERDLLRVGIFAAVLPLIAMLAGSVRRRAADRLALVLPVPAGPGHGRPGRAVGDQHRFEPDRRRWRSPSRRPPT